MDRIDVWREFSADEAKREAQIKRQIFEKLLKSVTNLNVDADSVEVDCCPELNPDVIVISNDQTMMFEAQNERASTLLRRKCGWETETISVRERIRVHPSQSGKLIEALLASGLRVAS
jgi:hypothetical protein